ncbi:hypothetical protein B0H12DRAFT_1099621 [Mycena haematopus]|nr:hypothetical protein B0H12DRAFT_1099621 [Mycena haematopus]
MSSNTPSSDAKLDLARDWDQFLHPLVAKHLGRESRDKTLNDTTTFTDAEGRMLRFGHTRSGWFVPQLLEMLEAGKDDSIEIYDLDKPFGMIGKPVLHPPKHPSGKWVVSQTKINLYGWMGIFTDYVMVEDLEPLERMLKALPEN